MTCLATHPTLAIQKCPPGWGGGVLGGRVEGALIIESLTMDYSRKYWNSQSSFPSISCEMGGDQNIPEYRTTDRVFHTDGGLPSPTLIKGGGKVCNKEE